MEDFFDEKSRVWIDWFKTGTKLVFWMDIAAAIVLCIAAWFGVELLIGAPFWDGLLLLVIGVFVAFAQLVCNMLIMQLLNNVQVIREKMEKMQ